MTRTKHPRPERRSTEPPVLQRGVGNATHCKSCGHKIVFASTVGGKLAPFQEDPNGLWTIENGVSRYLGKGALQLELGQVPPTRYTNHFSSCPQREQWRNKADV